jgi:hypothetical protein
MQVKTRLSTKPLKNYENTGIAGLGVVHGIDATLSGI